MKLPKLAKDIMVTRLVTLSQDTDVFKARELLLNNRILGMPVVDNERNFLVVFSKKCCMNMLPVAAQLGN